MTNKNSKITLLSLSLAVILTNTPCFALVNASDSNLTATDKSVSQSIQSTSASKVLVQKTVLKSEKQAAKVSNASFKIEKDKKHVSVKNSGKVLVKAGIKHAAGVSQKVKNTENKSKAKKIVKTKNTFKLVAKPPAKVVSNDTKKLTELVNKKVSIKLKPNKTSSKLNTAKDSKKIGFRVSQGKNHNKQAIVCIGKHEVIKYTEDCGGYTPESRAKLLVSKLQKFVTSKDNPNEILPGLEGRVPVGRFKGQVLFTVDAKSAKELHLTQNEMAIKCVNDIRYALGAPRISRDFGRIASRSGISVEFARRSALMQEKGLASWYGGKFHGRKAADGSIFSKYQFTAAHKTLPLGSFVRVTNLNNKRHCIVQITDRGPFVPGRIIDLSKAAAANLEMVGHGVSNVTIEVVNSF